MIEIKKKTNWTRLILFILIFFIYYLLLTNRGFGLKFSPNFLAVIIFYPIISFQVSVVMGIMNMIIWPYALAFLIEKIISKIRKINKQK